MYTLFQLNCTHYSDNIVHTTLTIILDTAQTIQYTLLYCTIILTPQHYHTQLYTHCSQLFHNLVYGEKPYYSAQCIVNCIVHSELYSVHTARGAAVEILTADFCINWRSDASAG